jgi:hypothetical protein
VESPEDVDGVLDLCHVLIKDQSDSSVVGGGNVHPAQMNMNIKDVRRQGPYFVEREEMAEEQGWVARMVHLFRAESLDVQFEVCWLSCGLFAVCLTSMIVAASTSRTETFRRRRRKNALHFPCPHYFVHKAMPAV